MGELLSGFGDLVFTLVIGYIGAIEFLYVVRHLYHWSFNHDGSDNENDADTLARLQDHMRNQLATAQAVEANAGKNAMQDGVTYEDGFRIDANQAQIDRLKEQLKNKSLNDAKRQELEKELAKQRTIEQQTRKELQEAEAAYARQQRENERILLEAEQQREREQKRQEQEEEAKRKAVEEEQRKREEETRKAVEEEQRKREEETRKAKEEEEAQRKLEEETRKAKEEEEAQRKLEEETRKAKEEEEAQRKLEEETRKAKEEEEAQRKLEEEKRKAEEETIQRNEEARKQKEDEDNARRLLEAEQEREREQRRHEEEAQRQAAEDAERIENENRILQAEREMEEAQRQAEELAENERKFLEIERKLEEEMSAAEHEQELTDNERRLIESIKQRDMAEQQDEASTQKEAELLKRILEAREQLGEESEEEQNQRLFALEQNHEMKQRRIDENARLFLEAEKEMADMQERMQEVVSKREFAMNLESAPQTPVEEELCIKKTILPLRDEGSPQPVAHRVKTQLAQNSDDSYSVSTKSLLFPGISDDASSNEPISSQQSSFSTQPSEEITTGNESQYPQQERQEPDGEDNVLPQQYSDDYLRSLDGIKQRPLSREDGSGRRRAFKKRRSSGSSNSSFESRTSREEELKMFTSLEEEEMQNPGQSDFTPIRYTSEPTLKVKGHHRRHKRSPAKDMKSGDDSLRSSLERLGEETINPWGDVVPEHYKQTEFWKREKAVSIDEEMELEKPTSSEEINYDTATNLPSASSFEEATPIQNQEALTNLTKQDNKVIKEEEAETKATTNEAARSDNNTNLQTFTAVEREASPARSSASPRLRRSPRIEEINQYEERWIESNASAANTAPGSLVNTPTIIVDKPLDYGSWRDEHGLLMEGLSDFYDFTASVNPSRSRTASRNTSPANTAPNTPQPRNVGFVIKNESEKQIDVYDDTNQLESNELSRDNIVQFMDSLNQRHSSEPIENALLQDSPEISKNSLSNHLQYVIDDQSREKGANSLLPMVNILEDTTATASGVTESENNEDINSLVASLRSQRCRSRSRSKSPLPSASNIQRSLESRRNKMIKHNEDILEKLIETNMLPETADPIAAAVEVDDGECFNESVGLSAERLRVQRSSSSRSGAGSRSRSSSPLPTPDNIERSIEHRRNKRIQDNDEYFEKLTQKMITAERNSQSPVMFSAPMISIEVTEPDSTASTGDKEEDGCSREEMDSLVRSLRLARSRSRSRTPMRLPATEIPNSEFGPISIEITESNSSIDDKPNNDDAGSRQEMNSLVQSLRVARSRSRSKSPMRLPTADNLSKSLDSRRSKLIERNDEIQHMLEERAKTPDSPQLTVEYVYEFVETAEDTNVSAIDSRSSRSSSPSRSPPLSPGAPYVNKEQSRSRTPSRSLSPNREYEPHDSTFHVLLNLEGSHNKTLLKNSEEYESTLAERQKRLDTEALEKLKNASEEIELRTLSPLSLDQENKDLLSDLPGTERSKMLRCSPTTPDYDRTISEEMRDVERIKQEMREKGFKRSTYVGESMDLGSEYEPQRREAAHFQRSRSPTPSITETETGQMTAAEKRQLQDLVLAELTGSTETRNTGAIPKSERVTSTESELSLSREVQDTLRIKEEILSSGFQRSTYVGESVDASLDFEEMRSRNAEFRRSASKSRSPLSETEILELAGIEDEVAKREKQDKEQDEAEISAMNFQDFSRHLNPNFFVTDRRASDSALIQKPEILIQFQDNEQDMEPEDYHHFRRFSLAQEQPKEEYPSDDYIFIQQVEVRTRSGSRTWTREDFYSQDVDDFLAKHSKENSAIALEIRTSPHKEAKIMETEAKVVEKGSTPSRNASPEARIEEIAVGEDNDENHDFIDDNQDGIDDDEDSNGSDDRRTVIEVEDEIDEDISDFNERGPADESQHEQSECEEADREMDPYAGREARDWAEVVDVEQIFAVGNVDESQYNESEAEGAVGGAGNSPSDSDSFVIDQIYDDAIKNRKQSGILREFDSILNEMTNSFIENSNKDLDEQFELGLKTKKKPKNVDFNINFIESERNDTEMRYLGDATVSARQSTRLRSRYGYNPVLQTSAITEDITVDLNYRPKREYNWRKNFKLDDDGNAKVELAENNLIGQHVEWDLDESNNEAADLVDLRKFSLGGESITLFSRSPEKEAQAEDLTVDVIEATEHDKVEVVQDMEQELTEKPKKKKTKKKTRKGSKASIEAESLSKDDDADESYVPPYSRRSSSIQMDTDSPKRKSRSRRSSRASLTNEDSFGLYSPRSSVGCAEPIADIMEEYSEVKETPRPKKMKKRKKVKEVMADVTESPKEDATNAEMEVEPTASAVMTPDSATSNLLSALSPQESVCVTPASVESETSAVSKSASTNTSEVTTPSTPVTTTPVDTFDILKDANFYPLF